MLHIINEGTDPYFNLALEEYYLNLDHREDAFIIWQNKPAVVVGRNQDTRAEVNHEFVRKHKIKVVRRLSGGGAVYHDLGNINFTFIKRGVSKEKTSISDLLGPVIKTLRQIGVAAEFTGRNDITVGGKKISGNARYFTRRAMLHHGTILFNTNLAMLAGALNASKNKYAARKIQSVRSRVTNVIDHIAQPVTKEEFITLLVGNIYEDNKKEYRQYRPTREDMQKISHLAGNRYRTWDWNYGSAPSFNIKVEKKLSGGTIAVYLAVKTGVIKNCRIYGDFFTSGDISELALQFEDTPYEKKAIRELIDKIHVENYLDNISGAELLTCFFESG